MRSFLLPCGVSLVLSLTSPSARAQEEDKLVEGKRASEWLAILRSDKDVRNRQRALLRVERAGPQTRKVFEEVGTAMRADSEEVVRLMAAQIIGRLGAKARDPERPDAAKISVKPAIEALIASLGKEKSARVRAAVAAAVGRIGPDAKDAVPALGGALEDASPDVRTAAAEALFRMGEHARDALDPLRKAVEAGKDRKLWRTRLAAVSVIGRLGRTAGLPAVPELIAALNEPAAADLSPTERRLLADVKRQLIETLGTLGDVAAAGVLTRKLTEAIDAKDGSTARIALNALTKLAGDKKALVPALIQAMAPPPEKLQDQDMRCEAIYYIGQLGKELSEQQRAVVVKNLKEGLTGKLAEVRLASIQALGELGPDVIGKDVVGIVQELKVLRRSPEKPIAEAAEVALKRLEKS
jgi:HEAT repeat protein